MITEEDADSAIEGATEAVAAADTAAGQSTVLDTISRGAIGIAVVAVWAFAVIYFLLWVLHDPPTFVCSRPGDPLASGYTGECTNGRSAAIDQAKDIIANWVLPVLTLVIGYYFGVQKGTAEDTQN